MKKQNVVNLIKYHMEKNDLSFKNEAVLIAKDLMDSGDEQLAKYVIGLLSGPLSFTTQDLSASYGFFNICEDDAVSLYLPTKVKNDLTGVINASRSKMGLNKFLFEGKPGTGKTVSALLIAKSLKRTLLVANVNEIIDSKLGQSSKNMSEMFGIMNRISKHGNYVFLIDEIDSLVLDRVNEQDHREMGRLTSSFLKELDHLDSNAVLIATTNLFKKLDRALVRRFDAIVSFDCYSKEDLCQLTTNFLDMYKGDMDFEKTEVNIIKKLFLKTNKELAPAEIKSLIRISIAFSGSSKTNFLRRLASALYDDSFFDSLLDMKKVGLTTREIETLSGFSKSNVARKLKEAQTNE